MRESRMRRHYASKELGGRDGMARFPAMACGGPAMWVGSGVIAGTAVGARHPNQSRTIRRMTSPSGARMVTIIGACRGPKLRLSRAGDPFPQACSHLVEGIRQFCEFVVPGDCDTRIKISVAEALDRLAKLLDAINYQSREQEVGDNERHQDRSGGEECSTPDVGCDLCGEKVCCVCGFKGLSQQAPVAQVANVGRDH